MPVTHTPTTLKLPAVINHSLAADWMQKLGTTDIEGALALNVSELAHFDSSAIALLLHAKRQGYTLDAVPKAVLDLARLYGVADLLRT